MKLAKCYTTHAILPPMKFMLLQENLRNALWERIEEGDLTGLRLAQQVGATEQHGDSRGLDGGRELVPDLLERLHDGVTEPQIGKGKGSGRLGFHREGPGNWQRSVPA